MGLEGKWDLGLTIKRNCATIVLTNLHLFELLSGYECWYGPVSILLTPKVYKVWANGELLAVDQLLQTDLGGQVLISHLLPHSPAHVHNLRRHKQ